MCVCVYIYIYKSYRISTFLLTFHRNTYLDNKYNRDTRSHTSIRSLVIYQRSYDPVAITNCRYCNKYFRVVSIRGMKLWCRNTCLQGTFTEFFSFFFFFFYEDQFCHDCTLRFFLVHTNMIDIYDSIVYDHFSVEHSAHRTSYT